MKSNKPSMSAINTEEYEQSYYSLIEVLARMLELHDPISGLIQNGSQPQPNSLQSR